MTKHNTRIGKIARLSHDIREQLNSRLREGEPAQTMLDWLNAIPSVQAVLNSQFDGHLISEQNLSEWRHGGFRDWQTRQDALSLTPCESTTIKPNQTKSNQIKPQRIPPPNGTAPTLPEGVGRSW